MTPALFKRPDATYIVALAVGFETGVDNYYLDYRNGRRSDVSTRVVPNFSKNNVYELPQKGATAGVFKRNG